ncbi:hypothetical protein [Chitinophaga sp.]|uniref:hypothetical protein n=1 Tax=Chitinophaga sp. TaxID=1869181 RepID=UPI002F94F42A
MSHPSKLNILQNAFAAGFKNYLYFISTESADINVNRVMERVKKGGHPVNEQKIRERYVKSMDLVADMLPYCHRCFFFDNSGDTYRLIAEVIGGETLKIETNDIPTWFDIYVLQKLGL